jgi:thymidylate kinase
MSDSFRSRRALLVSFSGIDGAGKSTQIANLCASLHDSGSTVQLITFWDDVATLKGLREDVGHKVFKGDKGVGSPEAPIQRRDKNVRSPLMTLVRMAIYVADAISLRKKAKNALRSEADVVIFDRYIYDELANLNTGNAATRFYMRGIMKLAPRPDVSFVLDADPEQAFARKPEYPLEFLHSNRNSYLQLSRVLGGITVIPPLPINDAKAEVVRYVFNEEFARLPRAAAPPAYEQT